MVIAGVLFLLVPLIGILNLKEDKIFYFTTSLIGIGFIYFSYIVEPQAIDVYRGKTELRVTYKENIPTDSDVVFIYRNKISKDSIAIIKFNK